ncbi:MAG: PHP domain-containing protein [Bacillales bacterium]|jgi:predicted metal-dependent phosphoesterase TrpH|nr:PHP domain-containing protein [Bacillales bacterium]
MRKEVMRINLHSHTFESDGAISVEDLIEAYIDAEVDIFAITDHNNVNSIEILKTYKGINYIKGCEITSFLDSFVPPYNPKNALHLLAYNFDETIIKEFLEVYNNRRKNVIDGYIYDLLISKGYKLKEREEYKEKHLLLLNDLIKLGYAESIKECQSKIREEVENIKSYPTIKETIDIVHKAGGLIIWAHPFIYDYDATIRLIFEKKDVVIILKKLIELGIDGIEAHYYLFNQYQTRFLTDLVKKNKLLSSVGTDFHNRGNIPLYVDIENRDYLIINHLDDIV